MRRLAVIIFLILQSGITAYAAAIDLTGLDIFVRRGFNEELIARPVNEADPGWIMIPGNSGNRPVRIRELGIPGVPRFSHFSITRYKPLEFTYLTSFELTKELYDSGNLGLYLAQIGLNWQIYLNGKIVRDEVHLDDNGCIKRERALRGVLIDLDRSLLKEGSNLLAFRIIGNPADDRTGLYMTDNYLIGGYSELQKKFLDEYPDLMLIAVYFFVSFLYLLIYALRRKELHTLLYGLASTCFAVTLLCRTKYVFNLADDTVLIQYAQFFSMFLGMPVFAAFNDMLLRNKISLFSRLYLALCVILCAAIPSPMLETAHRVWQVFAPVALLYMLIYDVIMFLPEELRKYYNAAAGFIPLRVLNSIFSTLLKSVPGNLLIGFCVILVCVVSDILNANAGVPTSYSQFGFFFIMIGITGILINQYTTVYNRLDVYTVSLQREIENHKLAVENLSYTRNYLENVFNSLPSMLVSIDDQMRITQCNTRCGIISGISPGSLTAKLLTEIPPFTSEDEVIFNSIMEKGEPLNIKRKYSIGGENRSFSVSCVPLFINRTRGAVIRVDDITELERKEEQLRQAQQMEIVGNLAGGLAHDFNNVLGGILGMASLIKFNLKKNNSDINEIAMGVDTIILSVERAADIVKQLLTISRRHELIFSPVDINQTVTHVLEICRSMLDKSIEIDVSLFKGRPAALADPTQIEQVLLNLCVNASHAMTIMRGRNEPYGGTLRISVEYIEADLHFCETHPESSAGFYWRLRVSDTGVGMDSETAAKIYDPFFTTKDKGMGTGLGLAMANSIIQQHNGFIDVYSGINIGTTFSVYLPVYLNESGAVEKNEKTGDIPRGTGTILVVDDEDIVREVTRRMLNECGYKVITAADGLEGLQIFSERYHEIDAVTLDMAMPKMSGKEAYIEMKKIYPAVRVLISSGFKYDQRVQNVLEIGADEFIQKPYSLKELALKIDTLLKGKDNNVKN